MVRMWGKAVPLPCLAFIALGLYPIGRCLYCLATGAIWRIGMRTSTILVRPLDHTLWTELGLGLCFIAIGVVGMVVGHFRRRKPRGAA